MYSKVVMALGWLMLVTVVIYLFMLFKLASTLNRDRNQYWVQLGQPSLFNPNGQVTIFWKIICGVGMPNQIMSTYNIQLVSVRISLAVGVASFLALLILAFSGIIH